jgi:hypothetical protein
MAGKFAACVSSPAMDHELLDELPGVWCKESQRIPGNCRPTADGYLRAVQLLMDHTKIESTVRYLGIEVDDALAIAEQVDV